MIEDRISEGVSIQLPSGGQLSRAVDRPRLRLLEVHTSAEPVVGSNRLSTSAIRMSASRRRGPEQPSLFGTRKSTANGTRMQAKPMTARGRLRVEQKARLHHGRPCARRLSKRHAGAGRNAGQRRSRGVRHQAGEEGSRVGRSSKGVGMTPGARRVGCHPLALRSDPATSGHSNPNLLIPAVHADELLDAAVTARCAHVVVGVVELHVGRSSSGAFVRPARIPRGGRKRNKIVPAVLDLHVGNQHPAVHREVRNGRVSAGLVPPFGSPTNVVPDSGARPVLVLLSAPGGDGSPRGARPSRDTVADRRTEGAGDSAVRVRRLGVCHHVGASAGTKHEGHQ